MRVTLLEVNALKMYYEVKGKRWVRAVDNVSIRIDRGESLGLAGESGSGKTSLSLSIMRLLPSNGKILGGEIKFENEDILNMNYKLFKKKIAWKKISLVPQAAMSALNPVMKVGDQIVEAIIFHENVSKKEALERAKTLFKLVGLDPSRINDYPHEFSGGMRQRAMIAMALACNPKLVIADEPTSALDVIVQAQILSLIKDLQKNLNLSMILVTHDLSILSEICNSIAVMYAGKIVEYGPTLEVYEDPQHPYTKGLLAATPSIKGTRRRLKSIPGTPPDLLNPPPGCRFHPRCPYAKDICKKEEPPLVKVGEKRVAACHEV
ncbi:MAG: ABC transporter ATP-binding protein [Candidatus Baldrarchaeia archaeon]